MNLLSSIETTNMPVTGLDGDELWYKDAIIYELHVKAFADSNNDGIGDFAGLTEKLGYLQDLGVTRCGCCRSIRRPVATTDMTSPTTVRSIQTSGRWRISSASSSKRTARFARDHRAGRQPYLGPTSLVSNGPGAALRKSSARNWYVWSDTDQKYDGTRIIFTDTEKSNWTWDPEAGQFYWHRFFSHQPDLNFDNPRVVSALVQVMKRWLDIGVDGFRLDAIPYLCERDGTNNENLPETHAVIKKLRAELDAYGKGMLLAEANQWPEDVRAYFGKGDECHMAFHFPLMPRIFMAMRRKTAFRSRTSCARRRISRPIASGRCSCATTTN